MTLQDGWNLTAINQTLDSQLDENINAVANLLGGISKFVPTGEGGPQAATTVRTVAAATNVPLGYYESVVGTGQDGVKRLYGWRYVGFMPFNQCPINAGGAEAWCCNETGPLYGLVFEKGVMVFKTLDEISLWPNLRRLPDPAVALGPSEALRARFEVELKQKLQGVAEVHEVRTEGMILVAVLAGPASAMTIAEGEAQQLAENSQLLVRVDYRVQNILPAPHLQ
jgi:hypothetical protein